MAPVRDCAAPGDAALVVVEMLLLFHRRALRFFALRWCVPATIVLMLSLPASGQKTFSAVADFSTTANTSSSTWSYRFNADFLHDGDYSLFPTFSRSNTDFWSPSTSIWNSGGLVPGVGVNRSSAPIMVNAAAGFPNFTWPSGTIWMHPSGVGFVIVTWLSPATTTVNIAFSFADMDPNGGDGIEWFVDRNTTGLANGTIANAGAPVSQTLNNVTVAAGDRIHFIVDPKDSNSFDSTTFTATITTPMTFPVITSFTAMPSTIQTGQSSMLSWFTQNADSVSIDNGVGVRGASGSASVAPAMTTTYKLTATGPGGSASATTTVNVVAPRPPLVAVTAFPTGMIQAAGQATATDQFTLANLGGMSTTVTLTQTGNFFTQTPTSFTLAAGASQVVSIRATAQQGGAFEGASMATGVGVPAGLSVRIRLVVATPAGAPVQITPSSRRPEVSAPANQNPTGTVSFTNSGSGTLQGIAVSDATWLIPQSGPITIGPGQTTPVTFNVDRTLRPDADALAGAAVARLSLLFLDFTPPPGLSASASGPSTAMISVSVVDVVSPGSTPGAAPALAAGEIALFAPGLPQRTGFSGDFFLSSIGTNPLADLRLFFTSPGLTSLNSTLGQLLPNVGLSFPSILKNVFAANNAAGTVQARSADISRVAISARQTNVTAAVGSFITALPTVRSDRSAAAGQRVFLTGVEKGSARQTNLYVQEVSGSSASVQVDYLNASGVVVGGRPTETVPAFALLEVLDAVPAGAIAVRITNSSLTPSRIAAHAMVVDAVTLDGWLITDPFAGALPGATYLPVLPGPLPASTQTDVYLMNTGSSAQSFSIETVGGTTARRRTAAHSFGSSRDRESQATINLTLQPLQTSVTRLPALTGYARVTSQQTFAISARSTLTVAGRFGTFGSALPPMTAASALSAGQSRRFNGVDDSSTKTIAANTPLTYRTSLVLLETAGQPATVRLTLRYSFSAGTRTTAQGLSSRDVVLAANQFLVVSDLSRFIIGPERDGYGDLRNMQFDLDVLTGSAVLPFLQVIDNGSADTSLRVD